MPIGVAPFGRWFSGVGSRKRGGFLPFGRFWSGVFVALSWAVPAAVLSAHPVSGTGTSRCWEEVLRCCRSFSFGCAVSARLWRCRRLVRSRDVGLLFHLGLQERLLASRLPPRRSLGLMPVWSRSVAFVVERFWCCGRRVVYKVLRSVCSGGCAFGSELLCPDAWSEGRVDGALAVPG